MTDIPTTVDSYNLDLHRPGGPIGAANPTNWNWDPKFNSEVSTSSDLACWKKAGISLLLIINSVPDWLGWDPALGTRWDGGDSSVPKDWGIWTDINKKAFAHYKDFADYFESINEPDVSPGSLSLRNSTYTNTQEAYRDIYYYAMLGWKQVPGYADKKLGGPSSASSNPYFLECMLGDKRIKDDIGLASWHAYGGYDDLAANTQDWRAVVKAAGKLKMLLFITEWGWSAAFDDHPMSKDSTAAISYAGLRLTSFINAGADGAFIYASNDDQRAFDAGVRHQFTYIDDHGRLEPKAATFRLLSRKLGLGRGDFAVKSSSRVGTGITIASAAINASGERVFWAVNDSTNASPAEITLTHLGLSGRVTLTHYLADRSNDATSAKTSEAKQVVNNSVSTTISLPAKSVYGMVVTAALTNERTQVSPGLPELEEDLYVDKVRAEWLGKLVGGALARNLAGAVR